MAQSAGLKREVDRSGTYSSMVSYNTSGNRQRRFEIGNAVLTQEGGASSALLHGLGNSTTRTKSGTANAKFISYYTEGNANGIYGFYYRHYVSTAATSQDAARFYATVNDVAAATVRGIHVSLSQGTTGSVTGLGAAIEATLHINTSGSAAGTLYGVKSAINSEGAASDPAGVTTLAYFAAVNQGDTTGGADVDDDAVLLDITGHTIANGNLIEAVGTAYALAELTHSIRIKAGGTLYYIPISTTAASAT
jgi:hypothetical protein